MHDKSFREIIPAQAGWFIVDLVVDGTTQKPLRELWKQPIIAWGISEDKTGSKFFCWATPICAETINREYLLMSPDGQITDPESASWDNVEEFFDSNCGKLPCPF